jgi:hypothetical protein
VCVCVCLCIHMCKTPQATAGRIETPGAEAQSTPATPMLQATAEIRNASSPERKQNCNAVVGIALGLGEKNEIVVAGVKPGTPAHRSRMVAPGDHIVRIDGHPVTEGMDVKSVVQRLCGPVGSTVSLSVVKQSGDEIDVVLVREQPVREQPSTSQCSSLNTAPVSPSVQPWTNPASNQYPNGLTYSLPSSQASCPPLDTSPYDRSPSHQGGAGDAVLSSAFADLNFSSLDGYATQAAFYSAGPRETLGESLPSAPIVWPLGMRQTLMDQMSPQMKPQHLPLSPQPQNSQPLMQQQAPAAEPLHAQGIDHNPFRNPHGGLQSSTLPSPRQMLSMGMAPSPPMCMTPSPPIGMAPSPRHMHLLGTAPPSPMTAPMPSPGQLRPLGEMRGMPPNLGANLHATRQGMQMGLQHGLPGGFGGGMGLAGGMMEPGMGMGMAMGRGLDMGSGSVLSQAEHTAMWNKLNNGTAGAGGGGLGGRGGFEGGRREMPQHLNGRAATGHSEWPGFMRIPVLEPGVAPTGLSQV